MKLRMVIIVTGATGIGKTTVCKKVLELAQNAGYGCGGIITDKMPGATLAVRDIRSGEKAILAVPGGSSIGPFTSRFTFDTKGIDFGIRAIEEGISKDILFVDEIGILEARGGGFISALDMANKRTTKTSILVIRKTLLENLLPYLDEDPVVFEITAENRDRIPFEIFSFINANRICP